jgi:hypothetical protein
MHLLELQGIVRHKPLPKEIGKKFSVHFGQVLPRKVMLPVDGDVLSFQITSSWVNICSRYIIAIAAHLSGDFVYSEALYLDVERLLVAINPIPKALEPLTLQLPKQIEALYIVWIEAIYQKYFFSRILESTKSIILSQVFQAVCDDIYSGCLGGYEVING